jgi:stage IV sporulation protein B
LSGLLSYQIQNIMLVPDRQSVAVGEPLKINFPAPLQKTLKAQVFGGSDYFDPVSGPVASQPGELQVRLSLFGVVHVRDVLVSVLPQVKVIPGGQSIGVLLHSQGVIVVGHSAVLEESGREVKPAEEAGIIEGDIILKINNETVQSDTHVRDMVAKAGAAGQPLLIEVKREGELFTKEVKPSFCSETQQYRLGLLIRDGAAGIGTLTFYEPESMVYGALGHLITDLGSTQPVELFDGEIVDANVQGIHRGKRGQPGEKIGVFPGDKKVSGTINKNTKLGIFGRLKKPVDNTPFREAIPVAMAEQIHEGRAEILTVLQDNKIEKFEIEIIKINKLARQDGKALVIKITDQKLLEQTGGIVQGMSGSPIIQDERLVGAITHVFVNDPTRGYGVPVQWMVEESGLLDDYSQDKQQAA